MRPFRLIALVVAAAYVLVPRCVMAAECPTESTLVSELVSGNRKITTCRCIAGYIAKHDRCVRVPQENSPQSGAERLQNRLDRVAVPPPLPARQVSIRFGRLAPESAANMRVLLGLEGGVASLQVVGTLWGVECVGCKLILATGNTLLAGENGAEVYLTRKDALYREALRFLKERATGRQFTAIVRALREGKAPPEGSTPAMVHAARAILDPTLGNSGLHMTWDALWSPDARAAMLTRATLELGGDALGGMVGTEARQILSERDPAVQSLEDILTDAESARSTVWGAAHARYLQEIVDQCNGKIAAAYALQGAAGREMTSMFAKWAAEQGLARRSEQLRKQRTE
jgi:hypothetical protein